MAELEKLQHYSQEVFEYIRNHGSRISDLKKALRAETEASFPSDANMTSQSFQSEMMEMTVQAMGAKKCLEIGVFTGYSSLCIALGMPDDGKLYALDISEEWTNVARRYWEQAGVSGKIELTIAPAIETLRKLIDEGHAGTFDFAYIDADKGNLQQYYEACLELVRPNGMIIADNVIWKFRVADERVQDETTVIIRNFNDHVCSDQRVKACILPFSDGVYQIVKL